MRKYLLLTLIALLAFSCSTKKAKWTNIAFHNTTAHYNVWWNGNESLKEACELIECNANDDYTAILPICKLGTKQEVMSAYPQLDRALEKGIKGIKTHSIFIKGKEYVPYVAECYLLTAYASFYKQDYETAANTCRVMRVQYAGSRPADEASILLGRCLAATQQYVEAEATLDQLMSELGKNNFNKKLKEKLYLAMAEATLPQEKYKKCVQFIKLTLSETSSKTVKARLNFIMAQIYQKLDRKSVAIKYYQQSLKHSTDYVMEFNAHIAIASCADLKHTDLAKLEKDLDKMLRDKKNEEYHDQIYYAKGEMYMGVRQPQKAVENYRKSVAVSTVNKAQKAKSALKAGEVLYDVFEDYDAAQRYYDTAMQVIQPSYVGYGDIKVRYEMLTSLTYNTRIIDRNDSLMRIADMSLSERNAFIQKLIENKKLAEEEARKKELAAQYAADAKSQQNTLTGDWYFYNAQNVLKGKETFKQRWGLRPLEDYWFLNKKSSISMGGLIAGFSDVGDEDADEESSDIDSVGTKKMQGQNANDPYQVAFYEKDLPSTKAQRDSMRLSTADALLNAGYLYYDGIVNYDKATACYLRLVNDFPDYEQIVQAFYMLYRIYDKQGNSPNANYYRDMVLMGFPDSDFANLIRDRNYYKEIARREQLLKDEYDEVYTTFRRRRYKEVVTMSQNICSEYPNDSMLPKFRFWEAMSYRSMDMPDKALSLFQDILKTVPATDSIVQPVLQQIDLLQKGVATADASNPVDESITQADEDLAKKKDPIRKRVEAPEDDEPQLSAEAQMFRYRENMQHYVVIIVDEKKIRATDMQYKISDFNTKYYSNAGYRVNPLMFTDDSQLITIHRFKNAQEALDYWQHLQLDESPLKQFNDSDYSVFPISTQNYTTFYSRKNIPAYLEFFNAYYNKK